MFPPFYIPLLMVQKKKLAFVSNTLWSIFQFRYQLIRRLLEEGFEILIFAPADDTVEHFKNIPHLSFVPLNHLQRGFSTPLRERELFLELKNHYRHYSPDLVFHYTIKPNIFGSLAAGAAGIKSVAIVTGLGYTLTDNRFISPIVRLLYKTALKKAARVWFLNDGDRTFFHHHKLIRSDQSFLLPGEGIDTEKFLPEKNSNTPGIVEFLMIGRLLKNKGVREFVRAAEILPAKPGQKAVFTIFGEYNPEAPDSITEKEYQYLQNHTLVKYCGYSADIKPAIAASACVVLPSLAEGMSMSIMEAAAMEKPVIVSDVPGCRELVLPGVSGFLCAPADAPDLAAQMQKFLETPFEERESMGKEGRKLMLEKYSIQRIIGMYIQNINELLSLTFSK